ncbi:MAG: DUF438 domain-containing protein [Anaerorhabdus sp.]
MSELLKKKDEKVEILKQLILRLHQGESQDVVKKEFIENFKYVSGAKIAKMEQQLVDDGMSIEEIMNLCDIHASLFQDNMEQLHSDETENHPYDILREENKEILAQVKAIKLATGDEQSKKIQTLFEMVTKHYSKKEQIVFPLLEQAQVYTIPKVMWGVDDEIRQGLREQIKKVDENCDSVLNQVIEMVNKEDNILVNVISEHCSTNQLEAMRDELLGKSKEVPSELAQGGVVLPSGVIKVKELEKLLNVLPFDITLVDKEDKVAFVSQGKDRIFDRPLTVLGRPVSLCHPPASVHIVEKILDDFKNKVKDHEHFFIPFRGKEVYIQYYAIYDDKEDYLGTVEVTQDIKMLKNLKEKRLVE